MICEQLLDLRLVIKDPKLILKEIEIFKGIFFKGDVSLSNLQIALDFGVTK